ncbi:MAG TPA: protein kinase [Gemmatimonadaceae bacterium]|nr:protein kinase [Gemmatimonadaceae bacterium]
MPDEVHETGHGERMTDLREQLQRTLGDSLILEQELGGGGMSRVFVAHEAALGRKVVVKVLPPDMAAAVNIDRFRREIQMAAQLQHPHIVQLLAAGETEGLPYFTMPFVKGESLRAKLARGGELPVSESVRVLREVASALSYAHENNVVHRDIKPENVLISGGSAMVTDFGVAKAVSASSGGASLTSLGVALGTPAYMAPEQATADPNTDHRADIYALGVLAYEMLSGSTPFSGRSPQAMLAAQVTESPDHVTRRRPSIPPMLANLVMWCLEKRPADRPQSAAEVVHELDALTTPSGGMAPTTAHPSVRVSAKSPKRTYAFAAGAVALALIGFAAWKATRPSTVSAGSVPTPALAVLPFENRGSESGQEFTDGMTEEITNRLSSVRGLRVVGRQSARSYAASDKPLQQIAQELGVQYLLTGTVRWDKDAAGKEVVRVSPALIRASDATQVWGEAYQTVLSGMFEVQSQVASSVASALNVALLEPERELLAAKPTDNLEAYALYLRGTELLRSILVPEIREAVTALERAVALDPEFAQGHAKLSLAHTELFWFYGDRTAERLRKAKAAADRALELSPGLPEGLEALGVYYYHGFLDYDRALRELAKAERVRPNNPDVLFFKSFIQRRSGRWQEAIATMQRGLELDPRAAGFIADFALTQFYMREFEEAETIVDRALIVAPDHSEAVIGKARAIFARTGDVAASNRVLRIAWERAANKRPLLFAALQQGWPATTDPAIAAGIFAAEWGPDMSENGTFVLWKAWLFRERSEPGRARAHADSAVRLLTARIRERPEEAEFFAQRGVAQAMLGDARAAIADSDRALALRPLARDALVGADVRYYRALTFMAIGRGEDAIPILEELLSIPSLINRTQLRLDPTFASLRGNPRFQRLIGG